MYSPASKNMEALVRQQPAFNVSQYQIITHGYIKRNIAVDGADGNGKYLITWICLSHLAVCCCVNKHLCRQYSALGIHIALKHQSTAIYAWRLCGYYMYHELWHSKVLFSAHTVYSLSLYSINSLVFVTLTECVYCTVRAESLNIIQFIFSVLERLISMPTLYSAAVCLLHLLAQYLSSNALWPTSTLSKRNRKLSPCFVYATVDLCWSGKCRYSTSKTWNHKNVISCL